MTANAAMVPWWTAYGSRGRTGPQSRYRRRERPTSADTREGASRGSSSVKGDRLYIHHVLECIDRITRYCESGEDSFRGSELIQDAVLRNLQTLAESTQRISARGHRFELPFNSTSALPLQPTSQAPRQVGKRFPATGSVDCDSVGRLGALPAALTERIYRLTR